MRRALSTKNDRLLAVPMFSACTRKELDLVAKLTTETELPEGSVLIAEGQPAHELVIILEGDAIVTRKGLEVSRIGAGDFVGEVALLDNGPRTATVIATSPLRVEVIEARDFEQLMQEVPTVTRKVAIGLARRLRASDEMLTG